MFETLAKEGVKTKRINELKKIKQEIELENCTFTPQINKNFKPRVEVKIKHNSDTKAIELDP